MPEFTGGRDIRAYIRTIWRWKFLVLVLVLAPPAIAYYIEQGKPKEYSATTTVSLNSNGSVSAGTNGGTVFQTPNIAAVAQLITTSSVANLAGAELKPAQTGSQAVAGVSTSADDTTGFITITAVKGSPTDAANVANAFATALNTDGSRQAKAALRRRSLRRKHSWRIYPRRAPTTARSRRTYSPTSSRPHSPMMSPHWSKPASPDPTPIGPHARRAAELGLVIGILLSVAVLMLFDSADRRLRSPDDLEQLTGLPLLSVIGPSAFADELETTPVDEEAFQTLRTALTYFTVDRQIKSVLITSPGEQEGKSTVAVRLSLAAARAGLDVVLVDADLRRAGSTEKLGLQPTVGLGLVLAERRPVESALVDWPLAQSDVGRLRVLGAGSPPPNPAALISSDAMRELVSDLESRVRPGRHRYTGRAGRQRCRSAFAERVGRCARCADEPLEPRHCPPTAQDHHLGSWSPARLRSHRRDFRPGL